VFRGGGVCGGGAGGPPPPLSLSLSLSLSRSLSRSLSMSPSRSLSIPLSHTHSHSTSSTTSVTSIASAHAAYDTNPPGVAALSRFTESLYRVALQSRFTEAMGVRPPASSPSRPHPLFFILHVQTKQGGVESGIDTRGRAPYTMHPATYTLHPAPCTLHPAPCTLHHGPCAVDPAPCTLHPAPCTCRTRNSHQPCEMGQILGWKILDLPCQRNAGVTLTKTFLTYL